MLYGVHLMHHTQSSSSDAKRTSKKSWSYSMTINKSIEYFLQSIYKVTQREEESERLQTLLKFSSQQTTSREHYYYSFQ